jgi:hypothetical protein
MTIGRVIRVVTLVRSLLPCSDLAAHCTTMLPVIPAWY